LKRSNKNGIQTFTKKFHRAWKRSTSQSRGRQEPVVIDVPVETPPQDVSSPNYEDVMSLYEPLSALEGIADELSSTSKRARAVYGADDVFRLKENGILKGRVLPIKRGGKLIYLSGRH